MMCTFLLTNKKGKLKGQQLYSSVCLPASKNGFEISIFGLMLLSFDISIFATTIQLRFPVGVGQIYRTKKKKKSLTFAYAASGHLDPGQNGSVHFFSYTTGRNKSRDQRSRPFLSFFRY